MGDLFSVSQESVTSHNIIMNISTENFHNVPRWNDVSCSGQDAQMLVQTGLVQAALIQVKKWVLCN